jgi:integrase
VSLARAREQAGLVRSQIEEGLDPVLERRKSVGIPTFEEAAVRVFAENKQTWRNEKHQWQWLRSLEMFAYPTLGSRKVNEITAAHVRDALLIIWLEKPETARRVFQRIGMVLDWAHSSGFRETEAPLRLIARGLPRQPQKVRHHAAMAFGDVPAFMPRLRERETWGRLALEAAILTAARSGEVRGATWEEIDLDNALWTVPAERMKAGKPHVVPLSEAALRVFKRAQELRAGSNYVFAGNSPKHPMSDMTLMKVLRDMGEGCTAHGFRSTFRDWVSEQTNFPGEIAEAALAHAIQNKTEAAYRRGDLLEKRRKLMEAWGSYCDGARGNVVRLAAG